VQMIGHDDKRVQVSGREMDRDSLPAGRSNHSHRREADSAIPDRGCTRGPASRS
jgi:hypothetical protein